MTRKVLLLAIAVAAAAGCAEEWTRRDATRDRIGSEMDEAVAKRAQPAAPEAVSQALLPPLVVEMPRAESAPLDQRFDLNVNNAPASQVFLAIVSGRRRCRAAPDWRLAWHVSCPEPLEAGPVRVSAGSAIPSISMKSTSYGRVIVSLRDLPGRTPLRPD